MKKKVFVNLMNDMLFANDGAISIEFNKVFDEHAKIECLMYDKEGIVVYHVNDGCKKMLRFLTPIMSMNTIDTIIFEEITPDSVKVIIYNTKCNFKMIKIIKRNGNIDNNFKEMITTFQYLIISGDYRF